jgi:hypothetical protein
MTIRENENGRVRAWVLIRKEMPEGAPPIDVAEELYRELGYKEDYAPGDRYLMIRADVVDYHYNIMIPVDALDLTELQDLVCQIQKISGATETAVLRVLASNPNPPHAADGFITLEEREGYPDECAIVGRQRGSPGLNPWG